MFLPCIPSFVTCVLPPLLSNLALSGTLDPPGTWGDLPFMFCLASCCYLLGLTRAQFLVPEIKYVSYPLLGLPPCGGRMFPSLHASSARSMLPVWHTYITAYPRSGASPMRGAYVAFLHASSARCMLLPIMGLPPCGGLMWPADFLDRALMTVRP